MIFLDVHAQDMQQQIIRVWCGLSTLSWKKSREYRIPEAIFVYFIKMIIDLCNITALFPFILIREATQNSEETDQLF